MKIIYARVRRFALCMPIVTLAMLLAASRFAEAQTDRDDDQDGVDNGVEVVDRTDPQDPDSFIEHAGSEYCLEWDGRLGKLRHVLEMRNAGCSASSLRVDLRDSSGSVLGSQALDLATGTGLDIALSSFPGFARGKFGQICATITSGDPDSLDVQLSSYRLRGRSFAYGFTVPYGAGRTGSQYLGYNRKMPKRGPGKLRSAVSGSIAISNLEDSEQSGALIYYDGSGAQIGEVPVTVPARGRIDAGVGASAGSSKSGLVEWRPALPDRRFRISGRRSFAIPQGRQRSVLVVPAKDPSGHLRASPFSTVSREAELELSNVSAGPVQVALSVSADSGEGLGSETLTIPAKATVIVSLRGYLPRGLGKAQISADTPRSIIATIFEYGSNRRTLANAADLKAGFGSTGRASYNNLYGGCQLRLANLTSSRQTAAIAMRRADGTGIPIPDTLTVPANGTIEMQICGNDSRRGYGEILIAPEATEALVGEVVRSSRLGRSALRSPLVGRGICTAGLSISPATLSITAGGAAGSITVTNNAAGVTATGVQATLPAGSNGLIQDASGCSSLAPGASCQLKFSAGISADAQTEIEIQGENTARVLASISVVGPDTAIISVSPPTLALSANGPAGSLTVTNTSTAVTATNVRATLPASWTDVSQDASGCASLAPGASCQLELIPGSSVYAQENVEIRGDETTSVSVAVSVAAPPSTTLSVSVTSLALSVNDVGLSAALTGNPRQIVVTNTGTETAFSVGFSASSFPAGTVAFSTCGDLPPAASCVVTITPGSIPSAAPGDVSPVPASLSVEGSNTNTLVTSVSILTYGSVHQAGYLFAVDDTTPNTGSIGGKVVSLTDQAGSGAVWSSDEMGVPLLDDVPGIYETSTNPPNACNGNSDGACNTEEIVAFYPTVDLSLYAAGLCKQTIGGFTDWYLPAICELGYDTTSSGTGCGTQSSPALQNVQSSLVDNGDIGNLSGNLWSSTGWSIAPVSFSWIQVSGGQFNLFKGSSLGVRCVRAFD